MPYPKTGKGLIKRLRALGGTWIAQQWGFAYYVYFGEYMGHKWRIQLFSTIVDAEREIYGSKWVITRDDVEIDNILPIIDPVEAIEELVQEKRQNELS